MELSLASVTLLYFLSYVPFAALTKHLSSPLPTLPTSLCGAVLCWCAYLLASGQWRRVRLDWAAIACGLGGAAILCSATLAYGLCGVSLILPILLMKGGVLLLAPLMDAASGARPGRRALGCLALAVAAVVAGAWHRVAMDGTAAALCCAAAYLLGYTVKLGAIGARRGDWGFFLGETTVTLLVALPFAVAYCAWSDVAPLTDPLALVAGACSQGAGVFGGLILLRRGTHTALVPVNRCASLLAGLTASLLLSACSHSAAPVRIGEWAGAALMSAALWLSVRPSTRAEDKNNT